MGKETIDSLSEADGRKSYRMSETWIILYFDYSIKCNMNRVNV